MTGITTDWRADRIGSALRGENPTVMIELTSGWAVIGDTQFLPGYCVMLSRNIDATKLADLSRSERVQFLADTDLLATAVGHACAALDPAFRRTNIDILGNADPFVHAHVFPRYDWEPAELIWRPVWLYPIEKWKDPATALGQQHDALRGEITAQLVRLASEPGARIIGTAESDSSESAQ